MSDGDSSNDSRVVCPVCSGTQLNPFGANAVDKTCKCCNGVGSIASSRHDAIKCVSADIQSRLRLLEAQALGFETVAAMEDHQRWLESMDTHREQVRAAVADSAGSNLIDIRAVDH